jgi:acid phosphatase
VIRPLRRVGPSPRPCRGAARRRDIAFIAALAVAALAAVATLAPAPARIPAAATPTSPSPSCPRSRFPAPKRGSSRSATPAPATGTSGRSRGDGFQDRGGPLRLRPHARGQLLRIRRIRRRGPPIRFKFRQTYPPEPFAFPFYVALGNHDSRGDAQSQYDYEDPEGRWRCPGPAYLLPVRFAAESLVDVYSVDSTMALGGFRGPKIAQWIAERIAERSAAYSVLALHHALYSSGIHGDSPELLALFAGSLGAGKIRVVLSGHDHDQELQERDADGDGIMETFAVSGAAGKSRPVAGGRIRCSPTQRTASRSWPCGRTATRSPSSTRGNAPVQPGSLRPRQGLEAAPKAAPAGAERREAGARAEPRKARPPQAGRPESLASGPPPRYTLANHDRLRPPPRPPRTSPSSTAPPPSRTWSPRPRRWG